MTIDSIRRPATTARITGGILGERLEKNLDNLLLRIDVERFVPAYRDLHGSRHAEPEFAGHYVDAALAAWRARGDSRLLARAGRLVEIMLGYQRADGYLGAYAAGKEFAPAFSVWNQQFSIMALLMWHEQSGDERALTAARRCADYISENYLRPDGPQLFDAVSQGIENTCILLEFVRLFEITGEARYLDFAEWIVERWESGATRFISATESLEGWPISVMVGSFKGLETVLCYRGILRLGLVTGNERYVTAVRRYWEDLRAHMIGPTGNGSIFEWWNRAAAVPAELGTDLHPYENCVAVGWMQLSAELAAVTGEGVFLDEFERTLYNHLLGSQAADGRDFSYYQGNVGRKVHATGGPWYACCRYRGMTMLARLGEHVVSASDDVLTVALYADSRVDVPAAGTTVTIRQSTEYPRAGAVGIAIDPDEPRELAVRLRIPSGTRLSGLRVNGEPVDPDVADGFAVLRREWFPGDRVDLDLELVVRRREAELDERPAVLTTYGPLVLAIDTREGTRLDAELAGPDALDLRPDHPADWSRIVRFRIDDPARPEGIALVDYATAGSLDPARDRFRIWVSRATPPC